MLWETTAEWTESNQDFINITMRLKEDGKNARRFHVSWNCKEARFTENKDWLTIRGWDGAEAEASDVAREFIEARRLLKRTRKGKETEQAF